MEYKRLIFVNNLLDMAEGIANSMLYYNEDSKVYSQVNPFNIHMYCISLGVANILSIPKVDYLRMGEAQRRGMLGYNINREYLLQFWNSSDFTPFKNKILGTTSLFNSQNYPGIFEFTQRASSLIIDDSQVKLMSVDNNVVLKFWEELNISVNDKFTKAVIGQHINSLLDNGSDMLDNLKKSVLVFMIDSQFGYIEDRCRDIKQNILMPPEDGMLFVELYKEWIKFLRDNPEEYFSTDEVPVMSKRYLDSALSAATSNTVKYDVEGEKEIPDTLKESIRQYLTNGGKAGIIISYINKIC